MATDFQFGTAEAPAGVLSITVPYTAMSAAPDLQHAEIVGGGGAASILDVLATNDSIHIIFDTKLAAPINVAWMSGIKTYMLSHLSAQFVRAADNLEVVTHPRRNDSVLVESDGELKRLELKTMLYQVLAGFITQAGVAPVPPNAGHISVVFPQPFESIPKILITFRAENDNPELTLGVVTQASLTGFRVDFAAHVKAGVYLEWEALS